MNGCPAPQSLESFLEGQLSEPEHSALSEHVRGCALCQQTLDSLTDDSALRQWKPASGLSLGTSPEEPGLARIRRELLDAGPGDPTLYQPGARGALPFLGPPQREGDLGALGPFRILRELGRGGMGVVLLAADDELERTVALKVLRPELADPHARQRFVREARAAARVRHDHVIGVYSVASPADGLPYFAMEYLAGPSLAGLIREGGSLDPTGAADIVAQAADGLQAAHAAGLIHRDIKPSNILIDPLTGRAKITDFGLARVVERAADFTQHGSLAGTPAYMSPEQAAGSGAIDGRSDVYSLGVTLYESLTGEAPFRGAPHMVLQQIQQEEPRAPRALNDAIPRDLETICLKAMAKEPQRRYATAGDLAADLRRWRRGEPIVARPAGPVERGWRWCERNRRVAGLLATVILLLTTLAVGWFVAFLWIAHERSLALYERDRANASAAAMTLAQQQATRNARSAQEHFSLALDTLNTLITRVQQQLGAQSGTLRLRQQLVESALAGLEQIAQSAERTDTADHSIITAHLRMGELYYLLGRSKQARREYDRARTQAESLLATRPADSDLQLDLALAHDSLGEIDKLDLILPAAEQHHRRALEIRQRLAAEQPANRTIQRGIAVSLNKLGDVALRQGDAAGALALFERSLTLREATAHDDPDRKQALSDLRFAHGRIGDGHLHGFRWDVAQQHYRKSLEYAQELRKLEPGNPTVQTQVDASYDRLGGVHLRLGRYAEAEAEYRAALASRESLLAQNPNDAEARRSLTTSHSLLGDALQAERKLDAARDSYRQALELAQQGARFDPNSLQRQADLIMSLDKLAENDGRSERYADGAQWLEQEVAVYRQLEADGHLREPAHLAAMRQAELDLATYRAAAPSLDDLDQVLAQPAHLVPGLLALRGLGLARRGQHAAAAETAERLRAVDRSGAATLGVVARIYALSLRAVRGDRALADLEPAARAQAEAYADRAIAAIRRLVELDPTLVRGAPFQPDLDSLLDQPGWQTLLHDLAGEARSGS